MNNNGLVTITEEEYRELRENALLLDCLDNAGTRATEQFRLAVDEFVKRIGELDD